MNKFYILIFSLAMILLILIVVTSVAINQMNSNKTTVSVTPTTAYIPAPTIIPALYIISTSPPDKQNNIALNQQIEIHFNKGVTQSNVDFSIAPTISFTKTFQGNSLIIKPTTSYTPGTLYTYIIYYKNTNQDERTYSFTTTGPTQAYLPDTKPTGFAQEEKKYLQDEYPDAYVANNTPFESTTFKIDSAYKTEPNNHYYFIVTKKITDENQVRTDVNAWLSSLQLSPSQIQSLEIEYH